MMNAQAQIGNPAEPDRPDLQPLTEADLGAMAAWYAARQERNRAALRTLAAALADDSRDLAMVAEWEAQQESIRGQEFDPPGFAA